MADSTQPPRAAKDDDMAALKADIAALRTDLEAVVKAIKDLGTTAVATAKRQHGTAVEHLADEARSTASDLGAAGRSQVAELELRVREQPLMAVGIAFAVGLVLGGLRR